MLVKGIDKRGARPWGQTRKDEKKTTEEETPKRRRNQKDIKVDQPDGEEVNRLTH